MCIAQIIISLRYVRITLIEDRNYYHFHFLNNFVNLRTEEYKM
jgi:hypothetical protein